MYWLMLLQIAECSELQIAECSEANWTNFTSEESVIAMYMVMELQIAGRFEGSRANFAFEESFNGVYSVLQIAGCSAAVNSVMLLQTAERSEAN